MIKSLKATKDKEGVIGAQGCHEPVKPCRVKTNCFTIDLPGSLLLLSKNLIAKFFLIIIITNYYISSCCQGRQ